MRARRSSSRVALSTYVSSPRDWSSTEADMKVFADPRPPPTVRYRRLRHPRRARDQDHRGPQDRRQELPRADDELPWGSRQRLQQGRPRPDRRHRVPQHLPAIRVGGVGVGPEDQVVGQHVGAVPGPERAVCVCASDDFQHPG